MKCTILPFGALVNYRDVVVFSRFRGQWMLSRHRNSETWETQGGRMDEGGEHPFCPGSISETHATPSRRSAAGSSDTA